MKRINIADLLNSSELLNEFCSDIENGSVCVIPTDTIYGFAVDASNDIAVKRVYEIKGRDERKPLILFMSAIQELAKLKIDIPSSFYEILDSVWPGALTAIFNKDMSVEQISAFHYSTIGVRIPAHNGLLKILGYYKRYFLTTSVNRSGQKPLTNANDIEKEFYKEIDWLVEDDEKVNGGKPSTIIDLSRASYKILRKGEIEIDENLTDKTD